MKQREKNFSFKLKGIWSTKSELKKEERSIMQMSLNKLRN